MEFRDIRFHADHELSQPNHIRYRVRDRKFRTNWTGNIHAPGITDWGQLQLHHFCTVHFHRSCRLSHLCRQFHACLLPILHRLHLLDCLVDCSRRLFLCLLGLIRFGFWFLLLFFFVLLHRLKTDLFFFSISISLSLSISISLSLYLSISLSLSISLYLYLSLYLSLSLSSFTTKSAVRTSIFICLTMIFNVCLD